MRAMFARAELRGGAAWRVAALLALGACACGQSDRLPRTAPGAPATSSPADTEHAHREGEPEHEGALHHESEGAHPGESGGGGEHVGELVELSAEAAAGAGIRTQPAVLRALPPVIETTGQVGYDADALIHVSPRIPGRALRVTARLGDRVAAGQVLAVLDSIELGQAKAAYLRARAKHELALRTYERERALRADRISSERELQAAEADFLEAAAERASAEQTLLLYGVARAELMALSFEDAQASHLPIRSPLAGTVVEKHVTVGELLTPDRDLFTIADLSEVWITIDVYERDLAHVHLGDEAEVRVESYPGDTFLGKISYLGDRIDPATRALAARIDVANPEGKLRTGAFARVRLTDPHALTETGSDHVATVVPESALQRRGPTTIVFVPLGERRFRATEVETGVRSGGMVQILKGLGPGQEVVVEGAFLLKSEAARAELGGGHAH